MSIGKWGISLLLASYYCCVSAVSVLYILVLCLFVLSYWLSISLFDVDLVFLFDSIVLVVFELTIAT